MIRVQNGEPICHPLLCDFKGKDDDLLALLHTQNKDTRYVKPFTYVA